jgi:peptidoglycan lytic transglycosylase G
MLRKLAILLIIGLVIAGAGAFWLRHRMVAPFRGFVADEVFVELPPGLSVSGIASRLSEAGVVPDPLTFRLAARLAGADRRLQAGEYRFAGASSTFEVVWRLASGDVYTRAVTFPEGLTIPEMAAVFERSGIGTADAFVAAASDVSVAAGIEPKLRTLEGYLFPDTYPLPRRAGADAAVRAMVTRFGQVFDDKLRADAKALGLTVHEAVTLASLIEKETARPEERPVVSAVYHNRLKRGMLLQCDPTVIYALMKSGKWTGNLRREDLLQNTSPYNTYRYPGLPPGPIAAPGRASLEAAVRPVDAPFLYFVSRNDGSHVFATTLEEHNRNVATWQIRYFRR